MSNRELKVNILCPTGQDATLIAEVLRRDSIDSIIMKSLKELCDSSYENAGVLLIAEEALHKEGIEQLNERLAAQEPWSDIPIIMLTTRPSKRTTAIFKHLDVFISSGNVILLERPLQQLTLLSSTHVAMRSRRRQFQVKELLIAQQEATKMRDDFISIAGHELKTPLTSLKLQTQMAKRMPQSFTPDKMNRQLDYTNNQIDRLNKLVDDMLDISRLNTGKLKIMKVELNFSELVEDLIERFKPQFASVGCKVDARVAPNVVGQLDSYKIEQIINNLFSNAIRYAPNSTVRVDLETDRENVVFRVKDGGPGINPQDLNRIFDRFERASTSTGGLGLGLYITREIAELHHGSIRAESEPGNGTTFILELPIF